MVRGKEVLMIKLGLGLYSILFYSILLFYSIPFLSIPSHPIPSHPIPSHPIPFHSCFGSNGTPPEVVQICISFKTVVLNPGIIKGL